RAANWQVYRRNVSTAARLHDLRWNRKTQRKGSHCVDRSRGHPSGARLSLRFGSSVDARDLTRIRRHFVVYFCLHTGKSAGKYGKLARLTIQPLLLSSFIPEAPPKKNIAQAQKRKTKVS